MSDVNDRLYTLMLGVWTALGLTSLALFHTIDGRPPAFDDAWYLETSLNLYNRLTTHGVPAFLYGYVEAFDGTKAPLIALLPLPFYALFGKGYAVSLLVNYGFLVITNVFLYRLAAHWYSPAAGLFAVVIYQTMPLAVDMSRLFLVEYPLTGLVIVFLYFLERSGEFRSGWCNVLLGVLLGLGLLLKILFPFFVAGPALLTAWTRGKAPSRGRRATGFLGRLQAGSARHPLWAILLPAGLIAGTWYAFNWRAAADFALRSGYGAIASEYSSPLLEWAGELAMAGLSLYYAAGLAVMALAAAVITRRIAWTRREWILAAWLAPAAVGLLFASNRLLRFALPILPVAAILLGAALAAVLARISRPPLRFALLLAVFALPCINWALSSLPANEGPSGLLTTRYIRQPDQRGAWRQEMLLASLDKLAAAQPYYVVVGVEQTYFNANLLSYLRAKEGRLDPLFTTFGNAQTSVEAAVERLDTFDARFLLMADGFLPAELPPFLNRVNAEVQRLLDEGRLPYQRVETFVLNDHVRIRIYARAGEEI